jgi:hypothetical protein
LFVKTQPVAGAQVSVVQTLLSPQTRGAPGWQAPPEHTSLTVHASPSEQAAALVALTQPVAGSQLSVVQTLLSLQFKAGPAWQDPIAH